MDHPSTERLLSLSSLWRGSTLRDGRLQGLSPLRRSACGEIAIARSTPVLPTKRPHYVPINYEYQTHRRGYNHAFEADLEKGTHDLVPCIFLSRGVERQGVDGSLSII